MIKRMKKKLKKITCLLLVFCMVAGMMPISAFAVSVNDIDHNLPAEFSFGRIKTLDPTPEAKVVTLTNNTGQQLTNVHIMLQSVYNGDSEHHYRVNGSTDNVVVDMDINGSVTFTMRPAENLPQGEYQGGIVIKTDQTGTDTQQIDFGYLYVDAEEEPVVTAVEITPAHITVPEGGTSTKRFTALVKGGNEHMQEVIWTVEGNDESNTEIDSNGILTVDYEETPKTLIVKATSTVDPTIFGTATVVVGLQKLETPKGVSFEATGDESGIIRISDEDLSNLWTTHFNEAIVSSEHVLTASLYDGYSFDVYRKGDSETTKDSEPITIHISKEDAPSTVSTEPGKITGVDSTMEYASRYGNSWKPITGTEVAVSGGKYRVRVKANGLNLASDSVNILVENPEYKLSVSSETINFGSMPYNYDTAPAGATITVTNIGTGTIEGIYVPIEEGYIVSALEDTVLEPGESTTFTIRPSKGLSAGSNVATFEVAATNPNKIYNTIDVIFEVTKVKAETPVISLVALDSYIIKLIGEIENLRYSLNEGNSYDLSDSALINDLRNGDILSVFYKENNNYYASEPQYFYIKQADTPEGIGKIDIPVDESSTGTITGVTSAMEYTDDEGGTWNEINGTTIAGLSEGTYYVRTKASGEFLASELIEIIIIKEDIEWDAGQVRIGNTAYNLSSNTNNVAPAFPEGLRWDHKTETIHMSNFNSTEAINFDRIDNINIHISGSNTISVDQSVGTEVATYSALRLQDGTITADDGAKLTITVPQGIDGESIYDDGIFAHDLAILGGTIEIIVNADTRYNNAIYCENLVIGGSANVTAEATGDSSVRALYIVYALTLSTSGTVDITSGSGNAILVDADYGMKVIGEGVYKATNSGERAIINATVFADANKYNISEEILESGKSIIYSFKEGSPADTVETVEVSTTATTFVPESSYNFTATVTGTNSYSEDVVWSIYGYNDGNTEINHLTGELYIGYYEGATEIIVVASSVQNMEVKGSMTIELSDLNNVEDLRGSVNINGPLRVYETIHAVVNTTNNTGTLKYEWYHNDDLSNIIGTGRSYTLKPSDMGKVLNLAVTSTNEKGTLYVYGDTEVRPAANLDEYTIIYDSNGGNLEATSVKTNEGKIESLPIPTRDGYVFAGWFSEQTGGTRVTTNTIFEHSATIYAQWKGDINTTPYFDYDPNRDATTVVESTLYAADGSTIDVIPSGESVLVYGRSGVSGDYWYRVGYNGEVGYINSGDAKFDYTTYDPDRLGKAKTAMYLKSGIGDKFSNVKYVPKGGQVVIYGIFSVEGTDWYRLSYGGTMGYASYADISLTFQNYDPERHGITTSEVDLKAGVGTTFDNVTVIPANAEIVIERIYSMVGPDWYRVRYGDEVGYISNENVKLKYTSYDPDRLGKAKTDVYLKSGIGDNFSNVKLIPKGRPVVIYGIYSVEGTDWYRLSYGGTVGYVSYADISLTFQNYDPERHGITTSEVALKAGVGTTFDNVTIIPANAEIVIERIYSLVGPDWYRVRYGDEVGYISTEYTKLKYTSYDPDRLGKAKTDVYLKSGIGDSFSNVKLIPKGRPVVIYGIFSVEGTDWYRLSYGGTMGYASYADISLTFQNYDPERHGVTTSEVALKAGVGTTFDDVTTIPANADIVIERIYSMVGPDWYRVRYGDKAGYIPVSYVK